MKAPRWVLLCPNCFVCQSRFNIVFDAAAKQHTSESSKVLEKAQEIMFQRGVAPDTVMINAKINHSILQGNLKEARDIFEQALGGVSGSIHPVIQLFYLDARQWTHWTLWNICLLSKSLPGFSCLKRTNQLLLSAHVDQYQIYFVEQS